MDAFLEMAINVFGKKDVYGKGKEPSCPTGTPYAPNTTRETIQRVVHDLESREKQTCLNGETNVSKL